MHQLPGPVCLFLGGPLLGITGYRHVICFGSKPKYSITNNKEQPGVVFGTPASAKTYFIDLCWRNKKETPGVMFGKTWCEKSAVVFKASTFSLPLLPRSLCLTCAYKPVSDPRPSGGRRLVHDHGPLPCTVPHGQALPLRTVITTGRAFTRTRRGTTTPEQVTGTYPGDGTSVGPER